MKRILFILLMSISHFGAAATLHLKMNINHQPIINQSLTLDHASLNWTIFQSKSYVLLEKTEKLTDSQVALRFLVVDTNDQNPTISNAKMIMLYGETNKMAFNDGNNSMELELGIIK